ncbi:HesB/YadR/YfhF family protein [Cytobacillus purgationiresistens]|uniref:Uncharacterized protein YneR n=1 Tax=Cytobacillus purgationiresistens TaxID=863449 RepID=A0ABU0ABH8_9BACI|nr:HesB/YadR/YfhF family protein [Cytobacillus purgationiresistens]MDQ0268613.1 uncharacterized protein YneR [Cytobacillus purgationiresistens]
MNISISDKALKWYKDEMLLDEGDFLRFFARYGGVSQVQDGFSLGISNEAPVDSIVSIDKNGIHFFIEEKDLWFFDGHDLTVEYDEKLSEPKYNFSK